MSNLNTLITILTSALFCSTLQLTRPFIRLCFTHATLKTTQYANNDLNFYKVFRSEFKATQIRLQQIIAWTQKLGKERQKWKDLCVIVRLPTIMFRIPSKTQFLSSRVILFQETLKYQNVISPFVIINNKLDICPPKCLWVKIELLYNFFKMMLLVVKQCVWTKIKVVGNCHMHFSLFFHSTFQ